MNAAPKLTQLRGNLLLNEPMSRHTSWRIGGAADRYYQPADIDDLEQYLQQLPEDEPVLWLGLGSNLLVRDGGIRGTVIATSGVVNGLELIDENNQLCPFGSTRLVSNRLCNTAGRFSHKTRLCAQNSTTL